MKGYSLRASRRNHSCWYLNLGLLASTALNALLLFEATWFVVLCDGSPMKSILLAVDSFHGSTPSIGSDCPDHSVEDSEAIQTPQKMCDDWLVMPAVGTECTWQYMSHVIALPNPMSAQCLVQKVKRSIPHDLCSQKPYSLAPEISQVNTNGEIYLAFLLIKVKINHNSFNK